MSSQHDINVSRRIRTQEYVMQSMKVKDAIKDPGFSYRSDVITTRLYCSCKDCIKFCGYGKPIKCIDPYLIDMRHTHWIYYGLMAATKTATTTTSTTTSTTASTTNSTTTSSGEPQAKRAKR